MGKEIKVGEIFNSNNYGDFEIIEEFSQRAKGRHKLFNIRFIETNGIRYNISSSDIRSGKIKDYYKPDVCNVGYIGSLDCKNINKSYPKEYDLWRNIIQRCYYSKSKSYKYYGAKGVIVCERWHCFANFLEDITNIKWYDKKAFQEGKLELDKDIFGNKKLYSLETCCFIDKLTNIQHQKFKGNDFIAIDPNGNKYYEKNIAKFAENHNLNKLCIYACLYGQNKQHKGWKFYYKSD